MTRWAVSELYVLPSHSDTCIMKYKIIQVEIQHKNIVINSNYFWKSPTIFIIRNIMWLGAVE